MDETEALSRLTFCGECVFWHPWDGKEIKEEYRGLIGHCNKPYEGMVQRNKDDFCSRGVKKRSDNNDPLRKG
jgi:hypothetical protein